MKHFYYTFLATVVTFTSCKNDDSKKAQVMDGAVVPFTQQTVTANSPQTPVVEQHNLFRENNAVTASAASVTGALNPAHGQPNHRCDIAVGAPLNSAPNKNATVSQTNVQPQATQMVTSKMSPPKVVTAKGMNPPHGEEGHRCDIAVGAPLNSKPAANTAVSDPPLTPNTNVQHPVPALLSTKAAGTKTLEEAINP
ncbi:MAG TPA: hypothetical protein VJ780_00180 [Flavobacterium sp.]|nr:hypothetical protein [Flavobacterium sp.]